MGTTLTDATPRPLPMTKMGAVIGTVPYMSPEQLDGKEVDARSDIFSLGAVLYEMVTGNRAFQGQSEFSVASAILHKDPAPISTLQPLTPPALERTIRVCLAKDPDERWQSASDLWNELRWISEGGSQSGAISGVSVRLAGGVEIAPAARRAAPPADRVDRRRTLRRRRGGRAARGIPLRATVPSRSPSASSTSGARPSFRPPSPATRSSTARPPPDNTPQIFAVRSDYPEPQPIGPRGMTLLAVSSKGELAVLLDAHYLWYRLFTGTLARMTLGGGAPREIQEGVRQADWSPDGSQLAIIREVGGKDRLEYPIGHVLREVSGSLSDVRFSPKGDRIAYFEHPRKWDDRGSVNTVDLAGNNTVLSDGYWSAARTFLDAGRRGDSFFGEPERRQLHRVRRDHGRQDAHRLPAARRIHHPGRGSRRTLARDAVGLSATPPWSTPGTGRRSRPLVAQHLACAGAFAGRSDALILRDRSRNQLRRVPAEDRRFARAAPRGRMARRPVRRRQVGRLPWSNRFRPSS